MTKEKKQELRHDFETIANRYADALLDQFGLSWGGAWWVGNKVGDMFVFGEENAVSFEEMIYIVDNDITFVDYAKYIDYNLSMYDLNMDFVSLRNWHNGIGLMSNDEITKLLKMKQELNEAIKESKEKSLKSFD